MRVVAAGFARPSLSLRVPVAVALALSLAASGCGEGDGGAGGDGSQEADTTEAAAPTAQAPPACSELVALSRDTLRSTDSGLRWRTLEEGTGRRAASGDSVRVHYTGCLTNGTRFDSSWERDRPFAFTLGTGQVIQGWDEGVEGMRTGEERLLVIPPELGYGARGAGGVIPPNSTLVFAVRLLEVAPPGAPSPEDVSSEGSENPS